MDPTTSIAMQQAVLQNNANLSMIKQSIKADQAIVNLVAQAADSGPTGSRGNNLNILV